MDEAPSFLHVPGPRRGPAGPWLRLLGLLPATYAFSFGLAACGVAVLAGMGVGYHDAETAMMLLAFLQFVPLLLWAFASKHRRRVWLVLAAGALGLPAAAWALQHLLLG